MKDKKFILVSAALSLLTVCAALFVMYLMFVVSERRSDFRQQLWEDRCTKWGENIPKEMEGYCEDDI